MNAILSTAALGKQKQQQQRHETDSDLLVNFYYDSPSFELSLDQFEVYALKRVKVNAQPGLLYENILRQKTSMRNVFGMPLLVSIFSIFFIHCSVLSVLCGLTFKSYFLPTSGTAPN